MPPKLAPLPWEENTDGLHILVFYDAVGYMTLRTDNAPHFLMGQFLRFDSEVLQRRIQNKAPRYLQCHIFVVMAINTGNSEFLELVGNPAINIFVRHPVVIDPHLFFEVSGHRVSYR